MSKWIRNISGEKLIHERHMAIIAALDEMAKEALDDGDVADYTILRDAANLIRGVVALKRSNRDLRHTMAAMKARR